MKKLRYIIFGFLFLTFFSCQKEEETIVQDDTQSFVKDSPIAKLLSRTAQNPTACDNILDNSSCFSVELPVVVTVNGQNLTINDQDDYQSVQSVMQASSWDDDIVHFHWPITIRYRNFQTQTIQNQYAFDEAVDECSEDYEFDEIDCIQLDYSFTMNIYDSNNQVANTVTITSNSDLFNFLANLSNNVYVAINYPISAYNSNGQQISINSNTELQSFIEDSIDDCDDDNLGGGGGNALSLNQLLVSGDWFVSYCYYDGDNETNYYLGYNFTFAPNGSDINQGTIIAQKNTTSINGDWHTHNETNYQRLDLNFDGNLLQDIETGWEVIEFNEIEIHLRKQESDGTDYLYFKKN